MKKLLFIIIAILLVSCSTTKEINKSVNLTDEFETSIIDGFQIKKGDLIYLPFKKH